MTAIGDANSLSIRGLPTEDYQRRVRPPERIKRLPKFPPQHREVHSFYLPRTIRLLFSGNVRFFLVLPRGCLRGYLPISVETITSLITRWEPSGRFGK